MSNKFQLFTPGEYFDWERPAIDPLFERVEKGGEDGPMPGMPGGNIPSANLPFMHFAQIGEVLTEDAIRAFNYLWNPYDPLYNDTEYAKSQGLPGVPAYPGFAPMTAMGPGRLPCDTGDWCFYTNDGADYHYERGIFAGDTLVPGPSKPIFKEVTPYVGDTRIFHLGAFAPVYDQKGALLYTVSGNTREGYKKLLEGGPAPSYSENMAEWTKYFPEPHKVTDEDWEYIKSLWAQERINGENSPFWEDVDIGYELPKTCTDGPVTYMHMMAWHQLGVMPIFTREELCDDEFMRFVFKNDFGGYLDETALHFQGRNIPGSRGAWFNHTGAYLIARTVTNFIGSKGYVSRFCWNLYPFFKEMRTGPQAADMFDKVPFMKGRDLERHGAEGDTCIGRAVVTDKYVDEKGRHTVDFAVWGETLDGEIIQACPMSAVLPSRKA